MSLQRSALEIPDFTGIVRLFPLPNLVLFPNVLQPLHIFEPRYRKMMRDALDGDGLIAMALLKSEGSPTSLNNIQAVHNVITVGKIIAHVELEDGRFNLLLKGISRATIIREIATELPFRMADVHLLSEPEIEHSAGQKLQDQLVESYMQLVASTTPDDQISKTMVEQDLPLGTLADLIAFSCDLDVAQQQTILNTMDVEARCRILIEYLVMLYRQCLHADKTTMLDGFPPAFSSN